MADWQLLMTSNQLTAKKPISSNLLTTKLPLVLPFSSMYVCQCMCLCVCQCMCVCVSQCVCACVPHRRACLSESRPSNNLLYPIDKRKVLQVSNTDSLTFGHSSAHKVMLDNNHMPTELLPIYSVKVLHFFFFLDRFFQMSTPVARTNDAILRGQSEITPGEI